MYGIDISEEAIERCIVSNGFDQENFKCIDLINENKSISQLFGTSFDIIIASEVLYHFNNSDINNLLEKFEEGMKPGGIFLANMVTYNHNTYRSYQDAETCDGLVEIKRTGSIGNSLKANISQDKNDIINRFKRFECIDMVRHIIDWKGECESYYYIGKNNRI